MRATRKKLQEQPFAYILQNRCSKKPYQKETTTQVFFSEISKTIENIFFFLQNTPVTTSEIKHILQLLIYYILEQKISIGMREP